MKYFVLDTSAKKFFFCHPARLLAREPVSFFIFKSFLFIIFICCLSGCAKKDGRMAPVAQIGAPSSYGKPYKQRNVTTLASASAKTSASTSTSASTVNTTKTLAALDAPVNTGVGCRGDACISPSGGKWLWPIKGQVVATFGSGQKLKKGLDIAARAGEPVHATASGKVVYSGRGLKGYGELIILKHNDEFLSAYAHNQKLLVKEGSVVKAGQVIALAGDTDAHRVMLHFEIRQKGKPVDPLNYLPQL